MSPSPRSLASARSATTLGMGLAACQGGPSLPSEVEGNVIVFVPTDLVIPKDVDALGLIVTQGSRDLRRELLALGPSNRTSPKSFPIRARLSAGKRVHVTAIASQNTVPILLAEADRDVSRELSCGMTIASYAESRRRDLGGPQ